MRLIPNAKRTKNQLLQEFAGKKILDVGCGGNKTPGTVGMDRRISDKLPKEKQADIEHDLTEFPWPLEDNSYDLIICQHVIEHMPDVPKVMEEFNRIVKPGGKIFLETPHFSWFEAFRHFEHYHQFTLQSFDYFKQGNAYYNTDFQILNRQLYFDDLTFALGIGFLANWFQRTYEKRFAFIFPATSFSITLQVP